MISYSFNGGAATTSNVYQVTSTFTDALAISITTASGKKLALDPINFIWQNAPLTAAQSTFNNGQKGGIVELFGWPWNDIAKECVFLGKAGYMGVKIWPPNEHVWGSDSVHLLSCIYLATNTNERNSMKQTGNSVPGI